MNNSTFCIEEFDGEESDSSNAPFKIVFGGGNEVSDSFLIELISSAMVIRKI